MLGPDVADVGVVFPTAGPSGGVERVAAELLQDQAARRVTSFVGETLEPEVAAAEHGIRHQVVSQPWSPRALQPVVFRREAARTLKASRPSTTFSFGVQCPPGDVFWVHSVHAAWVARGTAATVAGRTVPSQVRRLLLRHQVLLSLERRYFTRSEPRMILCTSQQEVDDLDEFYGVGSERTHVVPNGYDEDVFSPERRAALRDIERRRLGIGIEEVSLLVVANEWHRKGLGPVLEAVARLRDPRLRIDLVGRQAPDAFLPQASRLGLADRVHWHGSQQDVSPFYAAADVFVLPTTYEPFGIVIVEALAMGLPVVVSRLAGASPWVEPTAGILLDRPTDADELVAALSAVVDDGARRQMSAAAATSNIHDLRWSQILARVDRLTFG